MGLLAYLLFPGAGLGGGLAVAGLGWVWVLRKMQRDWGRVCDGLERDLQEGGREVLKDVVAKMEDAVQEAFREVERREGKGREGRKDQREVLVSKAREALKELMEDNGRGEAEKR